jgi:SAM-dependent methyltransferase
MPEFVPLDFAAAWQTFTNQRHRAARTDEDDRTMWASFADQYDARTHFSDGLQALLESLVRPGDTVLDVGAGTGRMALPLARIARQVTALDHSPAMLDVLRRKMIQQHITNIQPVETTWQQAANVPQHDVVIAIWSLYRQPDILTALHKLVDATRRTLVIADGDSGMKPPHEIPHAALLNDIWGSRGKGIPNYLYFAGMLWQIGVRADVRVIYEQRDFQGATPGDIARQLVPAHATPEQIERFAARAEPLFRQNGARYSYRYTVPVGVVTWTRDAAE